MKSSRVLFGLTSVVAATMCSTLMAQDNTRAPQPQTVQPSKPQTQAALKRGEFRIDVLPTKEDMLLDINANAVNPAVLFRTIAQKANVKILVSDDVNDARLLFSIDFVQVPLERILQLIASTSNLELGKVGDTYLVVRSTKRPLVLQRESVVNPPTPTPRFNPGQKPQTPRNWGAFPFNGDNIYVVPLGPDKKDAPLSTTRPDAKKDDTAPTK